MKQTTAKEISPKTCIFCGSQDNVTDDHIPPKNIFPKPRPSNLITVPSCKNCNLSASKDDEYFRLKLSMSQSTGNNTNARKSRETVFRSLKRPDAKGFRNSFIADIQKVQLKTKSGLKMGTGYIYDVDLQRIFRIVEKTVKGLYFYETGHCLANNCEVDVHSDDTLIENQPEVLTTLKQTILQPLLHEPLIMIGDNTFSYRFHVLEENPCFSAWILTFYGHVNFLSLTGPKRENDFPN